MDFLGNSKVAFFFIHPVDELRQTDLTQNLYSLENRMRRSNRTLNVEQMNDAE